MSVPLTINGVTFQYPQEFDKHWGPTLTNWSTAVTNALKPLTGGFLTLPFPTAGIVFRNSTNTANLPLTVNGSNQLTFNGTPIGATASLTNSHILVGNVSNFPADVAMSGDITINNAGVTTIGAGKVTNAMIVAAAGIAVNKLAALTLSNALVVTDVSGFLTTLAAPSLTEVGYLTGVTSAIQTQLNTANANFANFLPLSGGTMSGIINMGSNKIISVAAGTGTGQAITYDQVATTPVNVGGGGGTSTSSTSFISAGNTTVTIAAKSSTAVIMYTVNTTASCSGGTAYWTIFKDGVNLAGATNGFTGTGSSSTVPLQLVYIDVPGNTAPHTYDLRFRVDNGGATGISGAPFVVTTATGVQLGV